MLSRAMLTFAALAGLASAGSGCALIFGNVSPVEEKSEAYDILKLDQTNPDWIRIPPDQQNDATPGEPDEFATDIAYQSRLTASVITVNSACRLLYEKDPPPDLRDFTQSLLLGFTHLSQRNESSANISGSPGLRTTVSCRLNDQPMMLRTVVVHHRRCVFDLVYIARPEHFPKEEETFERFVASLRFR